VSVLAIVLLAVGVAGAIFRPRGLPAWLLPLIAAVLAVATTVLDLSQVHDALRPLASPLGFVLVAVPLAVSLDRVGVFHELAAIAARRRFVVGWLWILAALVVAFLNLDAAVVLLTPLYIRTARLIDVDPLALVFQPVLLASLASGVLAVSNLTNLLAAARLSLGNADFLRHLALPSVVASAIGWIAYRAVFRSHLRAHASPPEHEADRRALVVGLGAIALFLVLLVGGEHVGVEAWQAALVTEIFLILLTRAVPVRALPVGTVVLAAALAVLAAGVEVRLPHAFDQLGRGGAHGFLAGVVSANVINNLPATLVGLPHITRIDAVWPMLLGVNMGPTLVLTGSLAGLLWQEGARRAGVAVRATTYMKVGAAVGLPAMLAAYATLRLAG
jgi:arsenical pump membrane protein